MQQPLHLRHNSQGGEKTIIMTLHQSLSGFSRHLCVCVSGETLPSFVLIHAAMAVPHLIKTRKNGLHPFCKATEDLSVLLRRA